ncbi:MAG: transglutaminase family protein [Nesterenkonia sp.]|uniref:transglutaminase family protein n=1 Tax=Nesterenkonia marinintestina TaxID=2979865 RepID=UPI0021BF2C29|nr:transglutaminase family protein [Nesterenkonia sp. GX14115]MDO5492121.1 transglutaminase family protein [Nesterenkonia sp.]
MTRISVEHRTRYTYDPAVSVTYSEARMTPRSDAEQKVLESSLRIDPHPPAVEVHRDYWGTQVHTFDLHVPHAHLEVVATSVVEVSRREDDAEGSLDIEALASPEVVDRFSDYLPQTRLSEPGDEVRGAAAEILSGRTPAEATAGVFEWLREQMTYERGATGVHHSAEAAFAERRGVCQDLSHLGIGALRSLGIPARYVSGYIHPRPQAELGATVSGESHAWLEWWDGRWHSWDPTNHTPATDHHVIVGRGRDYADVTPFKGILAGSGSRAQLTAEVKVTRHA